MPSIWAINRRKAPEAGFTLVELLVVIPLVILVISAMVVAVINLSGASMRSSARAHLQNEVLAALDQIEQDVRLSVDFSGMTTDRVSIHNLATSANPLNVDRKLFRRNDCSVATGGLSVSEALLYKTDFVVSGNALRRVVSLDSGCTSAPVWQKGVDETLISTNKSLTMAVTVKDSNSLEVRLTAVRTVAGEDISYTGWMHVKSINF